MPRFALPTLSLVALIPTAAAQDEKLPALLADLPDHPRLFLQTDALAERRRQHADDPVLQRYVADVLRGAEKSLEDRPLRYDKRGPRLLHVSRECLRRIQALTLAFRWTGDERFARAARKNLLTVAAFPDWNPSHFLDTAEMSHAVGLGYDWLHPFLDAETRTVLRDALIAKGLEPGLRCYEDGAWWTRSAFNWNQVCNAGLVIGALAIAETDPDHARRIVPAAVRSLPKALRSYAPDGAWMEGPGYWDYATRYTVYGLAALRTVLGTDFDLAATEGLASAGWFPLFTAGPAGLYFNFADAGERARRRPMPCLMWLADAYREPAFADAEHQILRGSAAQPNHVVWYRPPVDAGNRRPLDRQFRGGVPLAVFRSSWDDPEALFCSVKAGFNQVNHGHLDLGSFVLDALGVRWAVDLGSDDYNLPGYWEMKRGGRRWGYFRLSSESHNVVLLDDRGQDPMGKSEMLRFSSDPPYAVLDLASAYAPKAKSARRGIALVDGRRAVLVQDELEVAEAATTTWGMTTRAEVRIPATGGDAELRQRGKKLLVRVLAPDGAHWAVESAERQPPERPNRGVSRLVLNVPQQRGSVRIAVLLCPVWDEGATKTVAVRPLARW